jgi:hypothetical protein
VVSQKQHRDQHDAPKISLHATWTGGARSAAWDRLWRMILSDLGPDLLTEDISADQTDDGVQQRSSSTVGRSWPASVCGCRDDACSGVPPCHRRCGEAEGAS